MYKKEDSARFPFPETEDKDENYSDIIPPFAPAKRLKIGTLKVIADGLRMGERFLKVAFDKRVKPRGENSTTSGVKSSTPFDSSMGLIDTVRRRQVKPCLFGP